MDNYTRLIQDNLNKLFSSLPNDFDQCIQATRQEDKFILEAFGATCEISRDGICFDPSAQGAFPDAIPGLLVSLYALNASDTAMNLTPLTAFKEFPDSMPYAGAFATHTEQMLVPYVDRIKSSIPKVMASLGGMYSPPGNRGRFLLCGPPPAQNCPLLYFL